jgi:phenylacetate-coenzyme A ligase PaaK-like adenylate-forming protein
MELFETLEFGARTLLLQSTTSRSREDINAIGKKHLVRLVEYARTHSEFWRQKLAMVPENAYSLIDLPTSSKPELMENFESSLTVDDVTIDDAEEFFEDPENFGRLFRDKYVLSHTSGSTGQPLIVVQPKSNLELLFELQAARGAARRLGITDAVKHLIKPARLAAVILKPGFYPSASAFECMPEGARHFLQVLRLSVEDENLYEKLAEFKPTHLTAYASVLHEIARAIEAGELSLGDELEEVMNISERLLPDAREHYAKVFGAPIVDTYSMGECLFLTSGCPASGGMHVNADWALLEVVDENNEPVPDGEKGARVLITNLANFVQPIIRYEIGDIVTMATEHCDCGNNMPLVERVEGRDSDVFVIDTENGEQMIQPGLFELAIGRMLDAREFQIVQEENTRFVVRLEPLPGKKFNHERAERMLAEQLQEYKLHDTLDVRIELVNRLAADGDQKFKRIVPKSNKRRDRKEKAAVKN